MQQFTLQRQGRCEGRLRRRDDDTTFSRERKFLKKDSEISLISKGGTSYVYEGNERCQTYQGTDAEGRK